MTLKSTAKALLLVAGLLILAVPARAAESLVLTCSVCDHVDAKASGLPAARDLRLTMTDLKTGQQVANVAVRSDAQGRFQRDVSRRRSRSTCASTPRCSRASWSRRTGSCW